MHASNRKIPTEVRIPIEEKTYEKGDYEKEVVEKEVKEEEHFIVAYLKIAMEVRLKEKSEENRPKNFVEFLEKYSKGYYGRPFDASEESSKVLEIMKDEDKKSAFNVAQTQAQDAVGEFLSKIKFPIKDEKVYKEFEELLRRLTPNFEQILSEAIPELKTDQLKQISYTLLRAYIFQIIGSRFSLSTELLPHFIRLMRNSLKDEVHENEPHESEILKDEPRKVNYLKDEIYNEIRKDMVLKIAIPTNVRLFSRVIGHEDAHKIYLEELEEELKEISLSKFQTLMMGVGKLRYEICNGLAREHLAEEKEFLENICELISNKLRAEELNKNKDNEKEEQRCDLYIMNGLPKNLDQYKNSYIFICSKELIQLHYVKANGKSEMVNINLKLFLTNLEEILYGENVTQLHDGKDANVKLFLEKFEELKSELIQISLSDSQVEELITKNAGHTNKKWSINVPDLKGAIAGYKVQNSSKPDDLSTLPKPKPKDCPPEVDVIIANQLPRYLAAQLEKVEPNARLKAEKDLAKFKAKVEKDWAKFEAKVEKEKKAEAKSKAKKDKKAEKEKKAEAKLKAKKAKKAEKEKRKKEKKGRGRKLKGDEGINHKRTASACQSLDSIHRISVRKQSGLEKSQHRLSSKDAHLNSGVKDDDIEKQKDAATKKLQRTQGFRRGKKALEQKQPSLSQRCTKGEKNEDKQPKFTPFLLQQPDVIKRGISPEDQIGEGASLGAGNPSGFWNKSRARQQPRADRSSSSSMPNIPSPSRNGGDN